MTPPFLTKLANLGLNPEVMPEARKSLQVVNLLSGFSLIVWFTLILGGLVFHMPRPVLIAIVSLAGVFSTVLLFNKRGSYELSKGFFLVSAYSIVVCLAVSFGPAANFQYYLIPGIGLALTFYPLGSGNKVWIYSLLAIPFWFIILYLQSIMSPLFSLPAAQLSLLGQISNVLVIFTSGAMFFLYALTVQEQLDVMLKSEQNLSKINDELSNFANTISHDLKSPIANIDGLLKVLDKKHPAKNADIKKIYRLISTINDNMGSLVGDVLDYSKAGIETVNKSWFGLNEMLEVICHISVLEPVTIIYPDKDISIYARKSQLNQVFNNIISNSVKYHSTSQLTLEIDFLESERHYIFSVTDNGVGVPVDQQEEVFNAFNTGAQAASKTTTGLGLSIVKKLVHKNGGEVYIDSTYTSGTKIIFSWLKG